MRAEKQLLLDEIQEEVKAAPALLITRYLALKAGKATEFRDAIRQTGGSYKVVPKRLLKKVAAQEGVDLSALSLDGHLAVVATGEDAVSTAKAVVTFSKDNDNVIQIVGGRIDGIMYGAEQVEAISSLPGRDEMRAQLLGLFEAPMSQTLAVMEALLTSVMHCLDNKAKANS